MASRKARSVMILVVAAALVVPALTACGGNRDGGTQVAWTEAGGTPTVADSLSPAPSLSPSVAPTSAAPSASARGKASPRPRPSTPPKPKVALPPPPNKPNVPPPGTGGGSSGPCPSYAGPKAPIVEVKAALTTAAGRAYWSGTSKPDGYTGTGSEIKVPLNLMKAIAWQESGWQSTIIACDGGIGTMQVMPATATWMNDRFRTSHDVNTLAGNTAIGAEYLEWLIMYFGLYYFGSFDLSVTAPVGAGGATLSLRDVVVAAYNVGPGAVEKDNPAPQPDHLSIPNQRYVDNVVALMSNCECLSY